MNLSWLQGRKRWGAAFVGTVAALLIGYSGGAAAQAPTVGIGATKHNLGSGPGPAGRNTSAGTAEICVFCHTPHGAVDAPAPLWNKRLDPAGNPAGGGTYRSYSEMQTPSLDGQIAAVGSVSLACLSCHDGTQAMDNIINAPGSGNVLADGGGNDGRTTGWDWTSPGNTANTQGYLTGGPALIGTDLRNDHPIGIQYCGGGLSSTGGTAITGSCKDSDFVTPIVAPINGNQIFWIETGGDGKQRTDLPLYVRPTGAPGAGLGPLVECASCHDPHVSNNQPGPAGTNRNAGETFLRISNASSAVCTACHVK